MSFLAKRLLLSRNTPLLAFLSFSSAFKSSPLSSTFYSSTARSMTKQVLVPIAHGSEEIETTCITDTLTRFGAKVTTASVNPDGTLLCTMSRGIQVQADQVIEDAVTREWDLIVLPGGLPGAEALRDCEPLIELLRKQKVPTNCLVRSEGAAATCYPAPHFQETIPNYSKDLVVVTENMITSQGPGTSIQFALTLGEHLFGKEKRDEIAKQMLVD